jgi:hypothetical protein
MRATHIDFKHPNHLRVEHNERDGSGGVWCVAPSSSIYAKLKRAGLPKWKGSEHGSE